MKHPHLLLPLYATRLTHRPEEDRCCVLSLRTADLEALYDGLDRQNQQPLVLEGEGTLARWADAEGWTARATFYEVPEEAALPDTLRERLPIPYERSAWYDGPLDALQPLAPERVRCHGFNLGIEWMVKFPGERHEWSTHRWMLRHQLVAYLERLPTADSLERRLMLLWLLRDHPQEVAEHALPDTRESGLFNHLPDMNRRLRSVRHSRVQAVARLGVKERERRHLDAVETLAEDAAAWIAQEPDVRSRREAFRRLLRVEPGAAAQALESLCDLPPFLEPKDLSILLELESVEHRLLAQRSLHLLIPSRSRGTHFVGKPTERAGRVG